MSFHVPHPNRITHGALASTDKHGNNGAFLINMYGKEVYCVASDGMGWEHVSVSLKDSKHCPNWEQMCSVKGIFWDEEDCVIQYHPPKKDYVNNCEKCLHLWRPTSRLARWLLPRPPKIMVGFK